MQSAADPTPARRPVIVWDLVLTIVLLVVLLGVTAVLFFFSFFFLAFSGDSCGAVECNYEVMGSGFMIVMFGPPAVALLAIIASVIVLVLRRIAFWIPIVGIVLAVVVFFAGASFTTVGVPTT